MNLSEREGDRAALLIGTRVKPTTPTPNSRVTDLEAGEEVVEAGTEHLRVPTAALLLLDDIVRDED